MFTLIIEDKDGAIVDEYSFEEGEFVIGRSQQVDIVLPADNVSRRHARLFARDGRCFIEDLKAANGIWLNGRRIYDVTELPRSAQVRIGDFFLHIEGAAFARPMGPAVYARLEPMPGSIGERTELLQPTVLVGRGKDCGVVLPDVSVSRIHAKLTQQPDGRITVEDLRSSNGTYVNDRRIDHQDLLHGDRIRFGTVAFSFHLEGMPDIEGDDPAEPVAHHGGYAPPAPKVPPGRLPAYAPPPAQAAPPIGYEPPASDRKLLTQVLLLALILLACAVTVWLSMLAYKNFVGVRTAQTAGKPVDAAKPTLDPTQQQKAALDDELRKAQDAVARQQWEEADRHVRRALDLDPLRPGLDALMAKVREEKKAGAKFAQAEQALSKKDYGTAITLHRQIPQASSYRSQADAALDSIAQLLEIEGDTACAAKNWGPCADIYSMALSTQKASPAVTEKYKKALGNQK
jgi:pSer/pThr/pTyr-binding forkhead associated (FHA) protein